MWELKCAAAGERIGSINGYYKQVGKFLEMRVHLTIVPQI